MDVIFGLGLVFKFAVVLSNGIAEFTTTLEVSIGPEKESEKTDSAELVFAAVVSSFLQEINKNKIISCNPIKCFILYFLKFKYNGFEISFKKLNVKTNKL